jgi:hypothetical protein
VRSAAAGEAPRICANIAPFWGLVIGYAVSRLLERKDYGAAAN